MEKHQAEQEDTLMKVIEMERVDLNPRPRASPADPNRCFKCVVTLATLMGLVTAGLLVGVILQEVTHKSTCKQDPGPSHKTKKVNETCMLKATNQKDEYDIFTTHTDATYFIHGQVKHHNCKGPIYLEYRWKETSQQIIQTKKTNASCPEVFFAAEVQLFKDSRIYLVFNNGKPDYKNTSFHIYEL